MKTYDGDPLDNPYGDRYAEEDEVEDLYIPPSLERHIGMDTPEKRLSDLFGQVKMEQHDEEPANKNKKGSNSFGWLEDILPKMESALSIIFDRCNADELIFAHYKFPELFTAYIMQRIRIEGREFTQYLAEKLGMKLQRYDRD